MSDKVLVTILLKHQVITIYNIDMTHVALVS